MLKDNSFLTFESENANGIKVLVENLEKQWVLKMRTRKAKQKA